MPEEYFSVLLQRQECLHNTSQFCYKGKSVCAILLSLLQRQECLDNTSQFCSRGKNACTILLNFVTEARVPGEYFSISSPAQYVSITTFLWMFPAGSNQEKCDWGNE